MKTKRVNPVAYVSANKITKTVQSELIARGYELVENLPIYTRSGGIYRTKIRGRRAIVVGICNLTYGRYKNFRGYAKFF